MFGFDPLNPAGMMQGRHSIKLMYVRKTADGTFFKDDDYLDDKLNSFIYGSGGKGIKSTKHLQFWNKTKEDKKSNFQEDGWVTDEELEKGKIYI